jgi:hypothetical protein
MGLSWRSQKFYWIIRSDLEVLNKEKGEATLFRKPLLLGIP